MRWSILICTLRSRQASFSRVYNKLLWQVRAANAVGLVEVLYEVDGGEMHIGEKRNLLMSRARGGHVCFVDDDDDVSDDYVAKVLAALETGPDCVGIVGKIWWHGRWWPFEHSVRHKRYRQDAERFYRCPNHLNPVRRSIAVTFPFPKIDDSEDTTYAVAMCWSGVLKTEVFVPETIYVYTPSKREWRVKK